MSTFTQNNARDYITLWGYSYANAEDFEQQIAEYETTENAPFWNAKRYHNLSTYAAYRYIKYLNKKVQAKYWKLQELFDKGEVGYDELVRDIGLVHQHPRGKYPIFSIFTPNDCYVDGAKDPSRETIMLYRLKGDTKNNTRAWRYTKEEQEAHYIITGRYGARQCYLDRLTKKEKAKLDMVRLLEPETWLEGFGGIAIRNMRTPNSGLIFILDVSE